MDDYYCAICGAKCLPKFERVVRKGGRQLQVCPFCFNDDLEEIKKKLKK